jgi:hypothetical protein
VQIYFFTNKNIESTRTGALTGFVFPHERGIAFEIDHLFVSAGLSNGGDVSTIKKANTKSDNCKDWILEYFSDNEPDTVSCDPGTFYKRIYRPGSSPLAGCPSPSVLYDEAMNSAYIALKLLLQKLEELFETIEPTEQNKKCYGHKVREVLLLACMEVESGWKAVLDENEYVVNGSFSTKDYVKLKTPMLLDGYTVALNKALE